jgi:hypothetical protein
MCRRQSRLDVLEAAGAQSKLPCRYPVRSKFALMSSEVNVKRKYVAYWQGTLTGYGFIATLFANTVGDLALV